MFQTWCWKKKFLSKMELFGIFSIFFWASNYPKSGQKIDCSRPNPLHLLLWQFWLQFDFEKRYRSIAVLEGFWITVPKPNKMWNYNCETDHRMSTRKMIIWCILLCMQICMENKWVFEWVKHEMYEVEMMWNLLVCRSFFGWAPEQEV